MKVKNNNIYSFSLTRTHSHTLTFNVLSKKNLLSIKTPIKEKKRFKQTGRILYYMLPSSEFVILSLTTHGL